MKKTLLILSIMTLFFAGCKKDDMFEKGDMGVVNGHAWVDLGLPSGTKWATCNVGATTPEEYGDYFAWGETTTKSTYEESNCPTYELSISELEAQGYIDSEGNLTAQYDAATAKWGGNWRMPTKTELEELINNCTWTRITQNGVMGYSVQGPSGASIFLPVAGYRNGTSLYYAFYGYYWSSTPKSSGSGIIFAYSLYVYIAYHRIYGDCRDLGQSVRPVLE